MRKTLLAAILVASFVVGLPMAAQAHGSCQLTMGTPTGVTGVRLYGPDGGWRVQDNAEFTCSGATHQHTIVRVCLQEKTAGTWEDKVCKTKDSTNGTFAALTVTLNCVHIQSTVGWRMSAEGWTLNPSMGHHQGPTLGVAVQHPCAY